MLKNIHKNVPRPAEIALFCAKILPMKQKPPSYSFERDIAWPSILAIILVVTVGITLTLKGVDILGLVASVTSSITRAPVTLYMTPYDEETLQSFLLRPDEVRNINISVNARVPINALGATILFPKDSIEILGFTKEKSFLDLWTEETAINEDSGEIHFSGGTTRVGGMMGTGTIITLHVRGKKSGTSEIFFKDAQVYPNDGSGEMIHTDMHALSFTVPEPIRIAPVASNAQPNTQIISQPQKTLPPNPDVNEDGKINLLDVSIMFTRLVMPYDPRFDLNSDGAINIADVSVVMSKVR